MNGAHIWQVFLQELKVNLRRKGFLFGTFGIPAILFVVMLGYQLIQSQQQASPAETVSEILNQFDFEGIRKAGIIDPNQVFPEISPQLEGILFAYEDVESAEVALKAGEIDVFYIIPADYLATGEVTLHIPGLSFSLINGQPIEQLFYTTLAKDIDPNLLASLRRDITIQEFNVTRATDQPTDFDSDFLLLYVFVIIFLMSIFITNGYLLQSVIEEKENKLIEILIASIRPTSLLVGKILALGIVGIIQVVTYITSGILMLNIAIRLSAFQGATALFNIEIPYDKLPVMFLYFIFGYLLFAGLYGAVGAVSNSMREGPGYAVLFTLPAILPFYFFAVFTETPNGTLPTVLSIIPITAPISMIMRMTVVDVPVIEVIVSISLLALSSLGAMWFAGRLFRVQTLLSGKLPKLRDIPQLLRG